MENKRKGHQISWLPIPGYIGYFISSDGQVLSLHFKMPRIMKIHISKQGYNVVSLPKSNGKYNSVRIARVVMATWRPNSHWKELQVDHINGVKTDDRIKNLRWVTGKENTHFAILNKLHNPKKKYDYEYYRSLYD